MAHVKSQLNWYRTWDSKRKWPDAYTAFFGKHILLDVVISHPLANILKQLAKEAVQRGAFSTLPKFFQRAESE